MKKRQFSVTKIVMFNLISLIIIWNISIFLSALISLNLKKNKIIKNITYFSTLQVTLTNQRLKKIERNIQLLAYRYKLCHAIPKIVKLLEEKRRSLDHSCNINNDVPSSRIEYYCKFIQIFCNIRQNYYLNNDFSECCHIVSCFALYDYATHYFMDEKAKLNIVSQQPNHDNFYWSQPQYISNDGWKVSVFTDVSNEIFIGLIVKLDDLIYLDYLILESYINLWLEKDNRILPCSSLSETMINQLQPILQSLDLHDGWQHIPGYMMFCAQLKGPGWQQITLFPQRGKIQNIFDIIAVQLPFSIVILLVLISAIFLILYHYLIKPLWNFFEILTQRKLGLSSCYLLENYHNKLDNIARVYNTILNILHIQFNTLDKRYIEKTQFLRQVKKQTEKENNCKDGRYLITISHELRTPLNGIFGALELLQKTTQLTTKQCQLIETTQQCATFLLSMVNNLLDFSSIEFGQCSLHIIEQTPLLPLLDQAMNIIQGPSQKKGLVLKTFVNKNVPLYLDIDGMRLRHILINLLSNAVKFTEYGTIFLNVNKRDRHLIFTVSDSGKGISPENQSDVFIPFFRSKDTTSQGTGLGLTIATSLAKMMGGSLELDSILGFGTCISFFMPLNHYQEPSLLDGRLSAPLALHRQLNTWGITCDLSPKGIGPFADPELCFLPGKLYERVLCTLSEKVIEIAKNIKVQPWQLNILLVDDTAINREIIGLMLRTLGQRITLATDGINALSLGRQQRFDLVLMDFLMPGMDGITCAQKWRHDPDNLDCACMITALSGNTTSEEYMRCKNVGIQHYLTKPITLSKLVDNISYAAEFQLQRNIPLQEQKNFLTTHFIDRDNESLRLKFYDSLHSLLRDIEKNINNQEKITRFLHTFKGILGQAGLKELLKNISDMENHIKHGLPLSQEHIATLRYILDNYFGNDNTSIKHNNTPIGQHYESI